MQSTKIKIGAIDAEYPYIKQVRSWYRWQCGQENDPALFVACYLQKKIGAEIPAGADMALIDLHISKWIDEGYITAKNCPELFPPAR